MHKKFFCIFLCLLMVCPQFAHAKSFRSARNKSVNKKYSKFLSGKEFLSLPPAQKTKAIRAYREFFIALEKNRAFRTSHLDGEIKKAWMFFRIFIDEAHGFDETFDCVFAGWPSKLVGGVCDRPQRQNPSYETVMETMMSKHGLAGSCADIRGNSLLCNPFLFGNNLCVAIQTRSDKSNATLNCSRKFRAEVAQGVRTEDQVLDAINEHQNELLETFSVANRVCSRGRQAGSKTCKNLENRILEIHQFMDTGSVNYTQLPDSDSSASDSSSEAGSLSAASGSSTALDDAGREMVIPLLDEAEFAAMGLDLENRTNQYNRDCLRDLDGDGHIDRETENLSEHNPDHIQYLIKVNEQGQEVITLCTEFRQMLIDYEEYAFLVEERRIACFDQASLVSTEAYSTAQDVQNIEDKVCQQVDIKPLTCAKEVGCNILRSILPLVGLKGGLKSKPGIVGAAAFAGYRTWQMLDPRPNQVPYREKSGGCLDYNSQSDCLTEIITSVLSNTWAAIKGVGQLAWMGMKGAWNYIHSWSWSDSNSRKSLQVQSINDEDMDLIESEAESEADSPGIVKYIKKKVSQIVDVFNHWVLNDVLCQKWSTTVPRAIGSVCEIPYSYACLDCNDIINGACAAFSVVGSEVLLAFLTGGTASMAKFLVGLPGKAVGRTAARIGASRFTPGISKMNLVVRGQYRLSQGVKAPFRLAGRIGYAAGRVTTNRYHQLKNFINPKLTAFFKAGPGRIKIAGLGIATGRVIQIGTRETFGRVVSLWDRSMMAGWKGGEKIFARWHRSYDQLHSIVRPSTSKALVVVEPLRLVETSSASTVRAGSAAGARQTGKAPRAATAAQQKVPRRANPQHPKLHERTPQEILKGTSESGNFKLPKDGLNLERRWNRDRLRIRIRKNPKQFEQAQRVMFGELKPGQTPRQLYDQAKTARRTHIRNFSPDGLTPSGENMQIINNAVRYFKALDELFGNTLIKVIR